MANEIVQLTRNIGTQEEPIREKWYPVVLARAVMMDDTEDAINIIDYIMEQIGLLDADSALVLETIKEIKDYINDDKDLSQALLDALANKVDKEEGKGLSSNDFTDEEKEKLHNLVLNTILYTNTNPILDKIGGIEPDTTFDNKDISEVLNMLLYPYKNPEATHLYYGTKCVDGMIGEKGVPINLSLLPLTTTVTKNTSDIHGISLINNDIELCRVVINVENGGNILFSMDEEERIIITDDTSLDIAITDIQDHYAIVENKISFVYPLYFGTIDYNVALSGNIVNSLTKIISDKESKEFTISCGYQKIVFTYPTVLGSLSSIKDMNGNELINIFDKTLINVNCADDTTQIYTIYISHYPITLTDFKIKFIF